LAWHQFADESSVRITRNALLNILASQQ
jgi:hypothetical protein